MDSLEWLSFAFEVMGKIAHLLLEYLKVLAWPAVVFFLALVYRRPLVDAIDRLREFTGPGMAVKLTEGFEDAARALKVKATVELDPEPNETKTAPAPDDSPTQQPAATNDEAIPATSPAERHIEMEDERRDRFVAALDQAANEAASREAARRNRSLKQFLVSNPTWSSTEHDYGRMLLAWNQLERTAGALGEQFGIPEPSGRNLGVLTARLLDLDLITTESAQIAISLQKLRNQLVHEVGNIIITPTLADDFVSTTDKLRRLYSKLLRHKGADA